MAIDHDPKTGAPPREIHVSEPEKKSKWWLWLLPLLALLALLFLLSRCGDDDRAVVTNETADNAIVTNDVAAVPAETAAAPAALSGLGTYLAGTEALPRTFVFERLNFETGSAAIRPADRAEVTSIATALKEHANARIRVVGFADARGSEQPNAQLGEQRAASVKAALVEQGIDGGRIDTGTGGESQPVDTNATASGQAENRRTEIVVLQR